MKRYKLFKKAMVGAAILVAGGTVLSNGCMNAIASVSVCGTILTFCTPQDQLNLLFPMLEVPDYDTDPSCTIPLGCGPGDLYTNIPPGGPGGDAPNPPADDSGGGGGGGN